MAIFGQSPSARPYQPPTIRSQQLKLLKTNHFGAPPGNDAYAKLQLGLPHTLWPPQYPLHQTVRPRSCRDLTAMAVGPPDVMRPPVLGGNTYYGSRAYGITILI